VDVFFPGGGGYLVFQKERNMRMSKFVTVSDEAFALTVVENFYDRWTVEVTNKQGKRRGVQS
jgi:hypothetical protein